jgi:hypothetical protein
VVVVVAPVVNLSGSSELDSLRLTDTFASELASRTHVAVVPVNTVLAALMQDGTGYIQDREHALRVAEAFDADATVVVAVSDYDAYAPRIGLVVQWYQRATSAPRSGFDPVLASRQASDFAGGGTGSDGGGGTWQVQRVFDAGQLWVQDEVREYDTHLLADHSPYSWTRHLKSQELFVRYSCWSVIRTMLGQQSLRTVVAEPERSRL